MQIPLFRRHITVLQTPQFCRHTIVLWTPLFHRRKALLSRHHSSVETHHCTVHITIPQTHTNTLNFLSCGTATSALLYYRLVTFSYLTQNITTNSALNFIEPCPSLEANSCADGQISQLVCDLRLYCNPQRLAQVRIMRYTYLVHTPHYVY